jgi:5-methyltetrahydropteroyltriglutamate--homocysteine methyltransferase
VLRKQASVGIDIPSDGEFGKFRTWSYYIVDRLEGIIERSVQPQQGAGKDACCFPEFYSQYFPTQNLPSRGITVVTGPIRYKGHAAVREDIRRLQKGLKTTGIPTAFMPVVAPASALPFYEDEYYGSEERLMFAMADALHEEYREIIDAGLILQIDDAFIPYMWDIAFVDKGVKAFRDWVELRIAATNRALKGLPQERIRCHVCWGSFNTPHTTDIPLRDIADLLVKIDAGAFCLEMANPRHQHEWRVWEEVTLPQDKVLIPGLISHATNVVEHPELVAERIIRLAGILGRERVLAGTDCGFAQGPHTERVHPTIMWAKLESLVTGARLASQQLWSMK